MPQFDAALGITAPELPWVPTPAHLVRRAAILDALAPYQPGRTLEVGCGSGALLHDLQRRGFFGRGVDESDRALAVARVLWPQGQGAFSVGTGLSAKDRETYDYLMAFEVLEHVEDHVGTLRSWVDCLRRSGTLLFSVPAHRESFGSSDEWAGHKRRYDRADVIALAGAAGCEVVRVCCYGFPLLNCLQPLSNLAARRKVAAKMRAAEATDSATATALSGVDRTFESRIFWAYSNFLGKAVLRAACRLQRHFYGTDLGTGYLVVARKP